MDNNYKRKHTHTRQNTLKYRQNVLENAFYRLNSELIGKKYF